MFKKIIITIILATVLMPGFSLSQTESFVDEEITLSEEAKDSSSAFAVPTARLGERIVESIKRDLPKNIKRIWEEEALPIWYKMWNWTKRNIWSKIINWVNPEVEKRKEYIKENIEQEKEEIKEEIKSEIPKISKSLWERFKELIR